MNEVQYNAPDLSVQLLKYAPNVCCATAKSDGVAPEGFHVTSMFPEYFNIDGQWRLIEGSRMDCAVVVKNGQPFATEHRYIKAGDSVVTGRDDDGSGGIYMHTDAFSPLEKCNDGFHFRAARTRETSYSCDYDGLYKLLKHERENGFCVWVLGPACTFDYDSRKAMAYLISSGYADAIFAGNALATHDLEAVVFKTALGQDIYTQQSVPGGHYHHLDTINKVRSCGGIKQFIAQEGIEDGIMAAALRKGVPYVLAGSIRDGPSARRYCRCV